MRPDNFYAYYKGKELARFSTLQWARLFCGIESFIMEEDVVVARDAPRKFPVIAPAQDLIPVWACSAAPFYANSAAHLWAPDSTGRSGIFTIVPRTDADSFLVGAGVFARGYR